MLSPRLLPSLCLVFISALCIAQETLKPSAVPEACPVTKPATQPFVPPAPYDAKPGPGSFWFGTDSLWTALPKDGVWLGGHYTPSDPTIRQKLQFFRQGFDARAPMESKLTVTGKRTDSVAPALKTDGPASPAWTGNDLQDQFFMTGINFPTTGCWEITAHYEDVKVTFVVWVGQS